MTDTRKIIIEKAPIGFVASRDQFDLGDEVAHGNTELEALEMLLLMEGK